MGGDEMLRWNKLNIPHKDWEYIGMEDLSEDVYPGDPIPYEQCEMCGKEKIRYVHLEDDLDTKTVLSISICIPELLDDNTFDYCEW
jgi:hypothetical protein